MLRFQHLAITAVFFTITLFPISASERQGFDRSPLASQWAATAIERLRAAPDAYFTDILDQARDALVSPTQAAQVLHYEGLLPSNHQRIASVEALSEVSRVRACLIAWLRTEEEAFAARAWAGTMAWVTTYQINGNAINENKLSSLASAWGLLRQRASDSERATADAWFRQLAQAQIDSATSGRVPVSNNWHTKRLRLVALIAVPLGDEKLLTWSREGFTSFLQRSIDTDGKSLDFRQRDSLGYHCGMLAPLLEILVALGQPELYDQRAETGGSAKDAVDFLVPYAKGDKEHGEFTNSTVDLDRRRAAAGLAKYQPGRIWERQRGAKVLGLAAAFDPSLAPVAEELARLAGEWPDLDALLIGVRAWEE